jgi:hypothetical protein
VVLRLPGCCTYNKQDLLSRLSAPCIGRSEKLVNSGLSGLSARPTPLGHTLSSQQSQGYFLLAGRNIVFVSRNKINACKTEIKRRITTFILERRNILGIKSDFTVLNNFFKTASHSGESEHI